MTHPNRIEPAACPGGLVILLYQGNRQVARHELPDRPTAETLGQLGANTFDGPVDFIAYDGDSGALFDAGRLL